MTFIARIGQRDYSGFSEITITESLDTICKGYTLSAAISSERPFNVNASVILLDDGEVLLNGWIDSQTESITADDYKLTISGRDALGDIVDCTPTGIAPTAPATLKSEFKDVTLLEFATALLDPFSLTASYDISIPAFERTGKVTYTVSPGESVFQSIEKQAANFGYLMRSDSTGNLQFFLPNVVKAGSTLELGRNLKEFSRSNNQTGLHSEYTLLSQKARRTGGERGQAVTSINYTHLDDTITRYRPKVFTVSTPLTTDDAKLRAVYEANTRHGRAVVSSATVIGWKTDRGDYWQAGNYVNVIADRMGINGELLIKSVTRRLTGDEKTTELELCRAGSYLVQPSDAKVTDKKQGAEYKNVKDADGNVIYRVPA